MPLPQQLLDAYHASMGDTFNGLPKMPKFIAEARVTHLQEELGSLVEGEEHYAERAATLNREIEETQEILATQNYSESDQEIAYWETYRQGLKTFVQTI